MITAHAWTDLPLRRDYAARPRFRRWLLAIATLAVLALVAGIPLGCAPAPAADPGPDATTSPPPQAGQASAADAAVDARSVSQPAVRAGIDVLLSEESELLRGMRVGLITNHTGLAGLYGGLEGATSTIDRLHGHPEIRLVALFGPEHGLRGEAEAGVRVAGGTDPGTGLPIYSLYGETRSPPAEALDGLDALIFDIQDIGTRYYTYVWTMTLAMQAAAEHGVQFVVLDRPNPIGGQRVQGNVLDPAFATFVGLYPVPMRHGLTAGELARYLNAEHGIGADLTVVRAEGWRRDQWYDDTGLAWIAPSPNMPSVESAAHYPGTCLFEGTNISVGRGTDRAFQQIGAPWLDHEALARSLTERQLPGLRIDVVTFTPQAPGDGKFGGQAVRGVRLHVTDRASYDPAITGIALVADIHRLHPDRLTWRTSHFDRLAGTDRVRTAILAGRSVEEITAQWPDQVAEFRMRARPYLLYD